MNSSGRQPVRRNDYDDRQGSPALDRPGQRDHRHGPHFREAGQRAGSDRPRSPTPMRCARSWRTSTTPTSLVLVKNYGKKEVDTDFSGPMGFIKLMQAMMGGNSSSYEATRQEDRDRLRRRTDHDRQERKRSFGGSQVDGLDHDHRRPPRSQRRQAGRCDRAAGRQPRRLRSGERPDLARNAGYQEADRRQHGRRGRQRRLLHLDGRRQDHRRARHDHRLDRRRRRQDGA